MSSVVVFLSLPMFVASALREVTVRSRQDAILQCWGPGGVNISLLEWSRPELILDGYVFFFQDQRSYESYQHESFRGRVNLRDPFMKDGDVSVVLRNVSVSDAGTYECVITTSYTEGGERVIKEFQHSISLTVTASGVTDENIREGGDKDGGDKKTGDKKTGDKKRGDKKRGDKKRGDKDTSVLVAVMSGLAVLLLVVIVTAAVIICRRYASSKLKSDQRDEKCAKPLAPA